MFEDTSFKKFVIDENNESVGKVEVNTNLLKNNSFHVPFNRDNKTKTVIKIGNRDYNKLDEYVVNALKDYYNKVINANKEEKYTMLNNYNHLYSIWRDLHNYKMNKNLVEIDKTYDAILFELYLIGYIN